MNDKYDFKKFSSPETKTTNIEPKYSFKPSYQIEKKTTPNIQKTRVLKRNER
jgi:hypothetical protein